MKARLKPGWAAAVLFLLFFPARLPAAPSGEGICSPRTSPAAVFRRANSLYAQKKYAEAARLYREIRKAGWRSSALYYNLGNACFKEGDLGRAVLNYRRAENLSPRDPEIRKNLQYARENLRDDVAVRPVGFIGRIQALLVHQYPPPVWSRISSSLYFLLAIWIILVLFIPAWRKVSGPVIRWLGIVLILSLLASYLAYSYYRVPRAIILKPAVSARYGPQPTDAAAFDLHEGTEIKVIRRQREWAQISLPDGKSGWIPADSLEII
jgi:tetratricopeptide (TPR) repeat protein